jgi:hypothetical protein
MGITIEICSKQAQEQAGGGRFYVPTLSKQQKNH